MRLSRRSISIVVIKPICVYTSRVAERFCGSGVDSRTDSQSSFIEFSTVVEDDAKARCTKLHRSALPVVVCSFATFSLRFGLAACRLRVTCTSKMHRIRWWSVEQSAPLIARVMQKSGRLLRLGNPQSGKCQCFDLRSCQV